MEAASDTPNSSHSAHVPESGLERVAAWSDYRRKKVHYHHLRDRIIKGERDRILGTMKQEYQRRAAEIKYAEVFRAQREIAPWGADQDPRVEVLDAFMKMLSHEEGAAPKLQSFIKSYLDKRKSLPEFQESRQTCLDWGVGPQAYLGVTYNGHNSKFGRASPRGRTMPGALQVGVSHSGKNHKLQNWLRLDSDVTVKCLFELIPPWKLEHWSEPGVVEFYLLLTDKPPEDFLALGPPRHALYGAQRTEVYEGALHSEELKEDIADYKRECWANMKPNKGKNPDRKEKKRLNPEEKRHVASLEDKAVTQAVEDWKRAKPFEKRDSVQVGYQPRDFKLTSQQRKRRGENLEVSKVTKKAKENHESVMEADPTRAGWDPRAANTTGFGVDGA